MNNLENNLAAFQESLTRDAALKAGAQERAANTMAAADHDVLLPPNAADALDEAPGAGTFGLGERMNRAREDAPHVGSAAIGGAVGNIARRLDGGSTERQPEEPKTPAPAAEPKPRGSFSF